MKRREIEMVGEREIKSICFSMYLYVFVCVYVYICICVCVRVKGKGKGRMNNKITEGGIREEEESEK